MRIYVLVKKSRLRYSLLFGFVGTGKYPVIGDYGIL